MRDEGLRSEPTYYRERSTRGQRRKCREGMPPADCEFFHDCAAQKEKA